MKTITFSKSILITVILGTVISLSACKGSKDSSNSNSKGDIPCKESGLSDKSFFRADASASSQEVTLSQEKALTVAKQKLGLLIKDKIEAVLVSYVQEIKSASNSEFQQKFKLISEEAVEESLLGVSTVCEKNEQDETGKYTTYIAIQIDKEIVLNAIISRISKDQKMRVGFDKLKFEEIFNREMEKFESKK